jgi:single-strand DNA-binding protein
MLNKAFLIGNLVRDPELRYTPSGIAVARFTIAVNRPPKPNGEKDVDFLRIVAWRRLAEICGEYLKKGQPVAIVGRLQIRSYEKDGIKRTISEVIADTMQMLSRRESVQKDSPVQAFTEESDFTATFSTAGA